MSTNSHFLVATFAVLLCLACCSPAFADESAAETRLLSFEAKELDSLIERFAKEKLKINRSAVKSTAAGDQVTVGMSGFKGFRQWKLQRGNASDGQWAMVLKPTKLWAWNAYKLRPRPQLVNADKYYGLYQRYDSFNAPGVFRKIFPADWSKHDCLRFDVMVQGAAQTIHVAMEDEFIAPPVVRSVVVQPGKWTTVEVNLEAARQQRGLNRKQMATLRIGCTVENNEETAREIRRTGKPVMMLLDNLRLAHAGVKSLLPLVSDDRPHELTGRFKPDNRQPQPLPPLPGDAQLGAIKLQKPFKITTAKAAYVSPAGWVSAYDNNRMLVGFTYGGGSNAYTLQTSDGG